MQHPSSSQELAPGDFFLFLQLKIYLQVRFEGAENIKGYTTAQLHII